jgi:hypothetical protein
MLTTRGDAASFALNPSKGGSMGHLRRVLIAGAMVMAGVLAAADPVNAAPVIEFDFNNVTGTTFLAKPMVTAAIPQSTIKTQIDLGNGTFKGQASIPDITVKLRLLNIINITSTVAIVPAGDLTGTLDLANSKLSTTTTFSIRIKNVHLDAAPGINLVTPGCQTIKTTSATLTNSTPIDLFNGTTVSGTFSTPAFVHCGQTTALLTILLSGPNNVLTLNLK